MKRLSIYIHIPFCVKKCAYCDFLSFAGADVFYDAYVNRLILEIQSQADSFRGYEVQTVFIGGGTPTVLEPVPLGKIVSAVRDNYACAAELEFTAEAGAGVKGLAALRQSGVNRLSLGLQSCSDKLLRKLGRVNNKDAFERAFNASREAGFLNINVDIMFGLPAQSAEDWITTLNYAAGLNPEHISAYGLILEDGTPLYNDVAGKKITMPDDETYIDMRMKAKEFLEGMGYQCYEISNYAKPGYECRHNMVYWKTMEYAGFGLGASSYVNSIRYKNETSLKKYLDYPTRHEEHRNSYYDKVSEFMFMGLRMTEGISVPEFKERFGVSVFSLFGSVLDEFIEKELLTLSGGRIFLTDMGVNISNQVFAGFIL
jgi:oxygen-independent coproporphyrinogen-3 oxidase